MKKIKILCWNDRYQSSGEKVVMEWLKKKSPDILCLQETKTVRKI